MKLPKMLEIRPYSLYKVVHECDDNGICNYCGGEYDRKLEDWDLVDYRGVEVLWWTCEQYENKAF